MQSIPRLGIVVDAGIDRWLGWWIGRERERDLGEYTAVELGQLIINRVL